MLIFFFSLLIFIFFFFFFSSRIRHTRWNCDWSSDVCSSDLLAIRVLADLREDLVNRRLHLPVPVVRTDALDQLLGAVRLLADLGLDLDRKSTRLNSSHSSISYAVFCLKKKT